MHLQHGRQRRQRAGECRQGGMSASGERRAVPSRRPGRARRAPE